MSDEPWLARVLGLHKHRWAVSRSVSQNRRLVFTTRKCRCGAQQIEHKRGGWYPLDEFAFAGEWEREWYEKSVPFGVVREADEKAQ